MKLMKTTIPVMALAILLSCAVCLTAYAVSAETNPNGSVSYYDDDGNLDYVIEPDGSRTEYNRSSGTKAYTNHPDGSRTYYKDNGKKDHTSFPDKSIIWYDDDGGWLHLHDGDADYYDKNGKLVKTEHPTGDITYYTRDGKKDYTEHTDGTKTTYHYHKSGALYYTKNGDGSTTYYRGSGEKDYTEHPDGSKTYYAPDGTISYTEDADGNKSYEQYYYPGKGFYSYKDRDGTVHHYVAMAGGMMRAFSEHPDGSVTYYILGLKKWFTTHPDGSTTYYDDNIGDQKPTRTTHPDGSVTYYRDGEPWYREYADGTVVPYASPPGPVEETASIDGETLPIDVPATTTTLESADIRPSDKSSGAETGLFNEPLSKGYTDEDGNTVTESPDGSKMVAHKDGTVTYYNADGTKSYTIETDGSVTYYDKDGAKIYTAHPDGSTTYYDKHGRKWYAKDAAGKETYYYYLIDRERDIFIDPALFEGWEDPSMTTMEGGPSETGAEDAPTGTPGTGDEIPLPEGGEPRTDWSTGGIGGGEEETYEMIGPSSGMETIDGELMEPGGSGVIYLESGGGDMGDAGPGGQTEPYEMIDDGSTTIDGGTEVYILE